MAATPADAGKSQIPRLTQGGKRPREQPGKTRQPTPQNGGNAAQNAKIKRLARQLESMDTEINERVRSMYCRFFSVDLTCALYLQIKVSISQNVPRATSNQRTPPDMSGGVKIAVAMKKPVHSASSTSTSPKPPVPSEPPSKKQRVTEKVSGDNAPVAVALPSPVPVPKLPSATPPVEKSATDSTVTDRTDSSGNSRATVDPEVFEGIGDDNAFIMIDSESEDDGDREDGEDRMDVNTDAPEPRLQEVVVEVHPTIVAAAATIATESDVATDANATIATAAVDAVDAVDAADVTGEIPTATEAEAAADTTPEPEPEPEPEPNPTATEAETPIATTDTTPVPTGNDTDCPSSPTEGQDSAASVNETGKSMRVLTMKYVSARGQPRPMESEFDVEGVKANAMRRRRKVLDAVSTMHTALMSTHLDYVDAMYHANEQFRRCASLEEELRVVREENESMLVEAGIKDKTIAELENTVRNLKATIEANDATREKSADVITNLNMENKALRSEVATLKETMAEESEKTMSNGSTVAKLEEEKNALLAELAQVKTDLAASEADFQSKLADTNSRLQMKDQEMAELRAANESLVADRDARTQELAKIGEELISVKADVERHKEAARNIASDCERRQRATAERAEQMKGFCSILSQSIVTNLADNIGQGILYMSHIMDGTVQFPPLAPAQGQVRSDVQVTSAPPVEPAIPAVEPATPAVESATPAADAE